MRNGPWKNAKQQAKIFFKIKNGTMKECKMQESKMKNAMMMLMVMGRRFSIFYISKLPIVRPSGCYWYFTFFQPKQQLALAPHEAEQKENPCPQASFVTK